MEHGVKKVINLVIANKMIDEIINVQQNSCCLPQMSGENQLIHDYWCQVRACTGTTLHKAYAKEMFGYDSECAFNGTQNFFYLLDLLLFINRDMAMTGNTIDYYKEKYDIDCIKKTFMCHGCNITNALAVFGMEGSLVPIPCTDPNGIPQYLTCNTTDNICTGVQYSFTPIVNVQPTVVTWSRAAVTGISNIAASGVGPISETLVNTTSSPVIVTYIITLLYNGNTTVVNHYVTVNPLPVLTSATTLSLTGSCCPTAIGHSTTLLSYTPIANIAGTTFTWSRGPQYQCSLSGNDSGLSGTGNIQEYLWCNGNASTTTIVYTIVMTTPAGCINTATLTVTHICGDCQNYVG